MNLNILNPRKSLNKAFLKVKPNRSGIETFKSNLIYLIDNINENESEEFHKNLVIGFLKKTYYDPQYFINTKGRNDLVIHNGKEATSPVGVIIETKKPGKKTEMLKTDNLNAKAVQELVLYYLRERITLKNLEIKYLIATDIYQWFIFDAQIFEKAFGQNKNLVNQFTEFERKGLSVTATEQFYTEIAARAIDEVKNELVFTWFDIREYEKPLRNTDKSDDNKLIALYKLLSPEHLLKLPFANDSNSLDKAFYAELLHIIGLTETKEGSKKVIRRAEPGKRNPGSLLENAINQLDSLDKISRLSKPSLYGETVQERLFNVGLELVITWLNRILFLKLLEAQLISYHRGNKSYAFLNKDRISDYDDLNRLFFSVLARKPEDRTEEIRHQFPHVPYLNSSLFESTEMEHLALFISNLDDSHSLPVYSSTVLKDVSGKRKTGALNSLEYFLEFLDAYDFSSEGSEEIQEENKTLINASVLGLIFEKINGYKDGSIFTPGFITMYMSRETVRRAVIQKFREEKSWECKDFTELYNKIDDLKEANRVINSLKVCDPAVGSGHFLVSVMNEIIAVKNDLKMLTDREGRRLKEYQAEVVNDELVITDEDGKLFQYFPGNKESQRLQEAIFHEKQTIIENCLFGVDINPNSVKICQLRLWIELLKNAYYKSEKGYIELETLPNIDINIKCGNSLVSRYPLDADLRKALKGKMWNIDDYRLAVMTYRNTPDKETKRKMEKQIAWIKSDFEMEISANDPSVIRLSRIRGELFNLTATRGLDLYEKTEKEKAEFDRKVKKYAADIKQVETEIADIRNSRIYENAFEWRFEFPEVLNDEGDFTGFDIVIGNPPYIRQEEIIYLKPYLQSNYKLYSGTADIYLFFVERAFRLMKSYAVFNFIMPNKWMQTIYGKPLRSFLLGKQIETIIDFGDLQVFDEATTYPCILIARNDHPSSTFQSATIETLNFDSGFQNYLKKNLHEVKVYGLGPETWVIASDKTQDILHRIKAHSVTLSEYVGGSSKRGILTGLSEAFIISEEKKESLISSDPASSDIIRPFLLGRDIRPYQAGTPRQWAILIPKGFTIKNRLDTGSFNVNEPMPRYGYLDEDEAWKWIKWNYPAVAEHLLLFKSKAEQRLDKGDFWWELRACDYCDQFKLPKIMYQAFQVRPCFIYDINGLYCNNSIWFIPTANLFLVGLMNSKLGWWLISKYCTAIQNGYQLIWKYFGQIPIVKAAENDKSRVTEVVQRIVDIRKANPVSEIKSFEKDIDQLIYELYGLTEEEIAIVEKT